MKFDVVVGNPPYQEDTKGENRQSASLYHYFYQLADKIADRYILISPARFLSHQGTTPKKWNELMLQDPHIAIKYFNIKASEVFPNTDIKGGVVVLYKDKNVKYRAIETFIPYEELNSIYKKVKSFDESSLSEILFSPDSYRFSNRLFEEKPELIGRTDASHAKAVSSSVFSRYPEIFFSEKPQDGSDYIRIYGRESNDRVYYWVKRSYLSEHRNLDKWKVFIPGANGSGALGEVISTPVVGQPAVGHNQTFISIGLYNTQFEANSLLKYIKTKFARVMLGIMKTTQNNQSKNTWSKVPLLDYTPKSDIDWTRSIPEIDQQLYKKYGLSEEEIAFIEEKIKSME